MSSPRIFVVFTNGVAIANYTKHWTDYEKKAGVKWGANSRITLVLVCKDSLWKRIAFQETDIANKDRKPSPVESDLLDDYLGHYRLEESGGEGEVSITRVGDNLYDSWAYEEPNFSPAVTTHSSLGTTVGSRRSFGTSPAK